MKNYYNRLDKEKRKEIRSAVKESNPTYKKINIYLLLAYLSIGFVVFDINFRYFYEGKLFDYILDGLLLVMLVIFCYKLNKLKDDMLNKYALKTKKSK